MDGCSTVGIAACTWVKKALAFYILKTYFWINRKKGCIYMYYHYLKSEIWLLLVQHTRLNVSQETSPNWTVLNGLQKLKILQSLRKLICKGIRTWPLRSGNKLLECCVFFVAGTKEKLNLVNVMLWKCLSAVPRCTVGWGCWNYISPSYVLEVKIWQGNICQQRMRTVQAQRWQHGEAVNFTGTH